MRNIISTLKASTSRAAVKASYKELNDSRQYAPTPYARRVHAPQAPLMAGTYTVKGALPSLAR